MPFPRVFAVLAGGFLLAAAAAGEMPSGQILARYRQMLASNPVEGTALDRLWKAYSEAGRADELLASYADDGSFAGRMILGHLFRKAGNTRAAAVYAEAAALAPKSPLPLLSLAHLYEGEEKPREAAESYEKAIALLDAGSPRLPDSLLALGSAWLAGGDAAKASEAWERLLALAPADLDLRRRLADQYIRSHLIDRAIPHLEALAAQSGPSERARAYQQLAEAHQSLGRDDAAIRALEAGISLTTPGNWLRAELQGQLIRLHQRLGRTAELEARWQKYAAENPRDAGGLIQLADLYHRLGDLEKERLSVSRLVDLIPKNSDHRLRLARLLVRLDLLPAAIEQYDRLLADAPDNPDYLLERADIDIRQGAPTQAAQRLLAHTRNRKDDESYRLKLLDFFQENRMWPQVESLLREDAAGDSDEAVLALTNFLFSQRRETEAVEELHRLVRPSAPPLDQAAAWLRVAGVMKEQSRLVAALQAAEQSVALAAGAPARQREAHLLAAELQSAQGDLTPARTHLDAAAALSQSADEIAETDQKLFDLMQQTAGAEARQREHSSPLAPAPTAPPPLSEPAPSELEAAKYADALSQAAAAAPTEAKWLRVARWRSWARQPQLAIEAIGNALAVNPSSTAAHELAIKLLAGEPASTSAQWHLEQLAKINPVNAPSYRRRMAQLELQAGHTGEAVLQLETLAKGRGDSLDLLTDLASAQQAAERWSDALETWRRVYTLTPPARRREMLAPLLRIYERLGQPRPAAELWLEQIRTEIPDKEKTEIFDDLLAHCVSHNLLGWLRSQWELRRSTLRDDFFTEVSYCKLLKADGDRAGAFETLANALYTAPDPADALPELVREAEELRRYDAAIEFQRRLTRLGPQNHPENLERLADLYEKEFQITEAETVWESVAARFPRDADALNLAVEFFIRTGNAVRAARLLRQVRALDSQNAGPLLTLAKLDLETGETGEAETCLEELLRVLPIDPAPADSAPATAGLARPTGGLRFPLLNQENAGRLQSDYLAAVNQRHGKLDPETMRALRGFWLEAAGEGKTDSDLRLGAVRLLARLIRGKNDPAAIAAWIARWRKVEEAQPSEALWALFYADAGPPALDLIERRLARNPTDEISRQGFIWMALQLREFTRLAAWLDRQPHTPSGRDFLRVALTQYLQAHSARSESALFDALCPPGSSSRLWELAEVCQNTGNFAEAARLGERAAAVAMEPSRVIQLAQWRLCVGDAAAACRGLTAAARQPAESYDAPAFAALREAFLLTPDSERQAFAERAERQAAEGSSLIHRALTRLLLHALLGDTTDATPEIDRLLSMRVMAAATDDDNNSRAPTGAGSRFWTFVLSTGLHLQAWRFERLAAELWEHALADPACVHLEGELAGELARETRARLYAIKIALADASSIDALTSEYLRGSQPLEGLGAVGEALETMGALPAAIQFYLRFWEREPSNPQPLRNLLAACRSAGDTATAERVLRTCVSQRLFAQNDNVHRDLVMQLVDALERREQFPEAQQLLADAIMLAPYDTRLLNALAQLYERAGQLAEAETGWLQLLKIEPGNASARLGLATLLEKEGKLPESLGILLKGARGNEPQLVRLEYLNGQADDALTTLDRLTGPQYTEAVKTLAAAMIAKRDLKRARTLLQTAITHTSDPTAAIELQSLLISTLSGASDPALVTREMNRLRHLARDDPGRLGLYYSYAQLHAAELGLEKPVAAELHAAWAEGGGLLQAGLVLLSWQLDRKEKEADKTFQELLDRSDLTETWLRALVSPLLTANRLDLAARIRLRLLEANPLDDARVIDLVETLDRAGRRDDAIAALTKWGARARIAEDFAPKVAEAWLRLGQPEIADSFLRDIAGPNAILRAYQPFLIYARLQLSQGRLRAARLSLGRAYQHPAATEYDVLVDWLEAQGKRAGSDAELAPFALSPFHLAGARRALFDSLEKKGLAGDALVLLGARPELFDRKMPARIRRLSAGSGKFSQGAELLQTTLSQGSTFPEITDELALLFADWAEDDLSSGRTPDAVTHLQNAQDLRPTLFEIAKKLWKLHRDRKEPDQAREALTRFLTAATDPKDAKNRDQVLHLLTQ